MNVGYYNKKGTEAVIKDNIFTFSCSKPVIIQSSEIKKIQTGVTLDIESGYVLTIVSDPNIYNRAAEVFPGPYVIDNNSPKSVLEIPVRNHAGSPLHLMEGAVIARGYLTQIAEINIKEIEPEPEVKPMRKSTPIKKGSKIKFEVT